MIQADVFFFFQEQDGYRRGHEEGASFKRHGAGLFPQNSAKRLVKF